MPCIECQASDVRGDSEPKTIIQLTVKLHREYSSINKDGLLERSVYLSLKEAAAILTLFYNQRHIKFIAFPK